MTTHVKKIVTATLTRHLPDIDEEFLQDSSLPLKDLNLDSLAVLEIIYELEEEFATELADSQLEAISTIDDLVATFSASASASLQPAA